MITLILLLGIFVFGFAVTGIAKKYKDKYNYNMFFTFSSLGIFVSEFLVWMGLVLSSNLTIQNPDLKNYIQYDFSIAVVAVAALVLLYCLVLNMVRSNVFWGILQTAFQIIFVAIFGMFLGFQYLSRTESSASMGSH